MTEEAEKQRLRDEVRSQLSREDSEYIRDFYQRHREATIVIDSYTGLPVEAVYPSVYQDHIKNVRTIAEALVSLRLAHPKLSALRTTKEPRNPPEKPQEGR